MKKGRLLSLVLFSLSISSFVFAEPPIKLIYWKSSDVQSPSQADLDSAHKATVEVQAFFASEMERHGFGPKTFAFDPDITVINGKLKRSQYASLVEMHRETPLIEWGLSNQIYVVFLGGEGPISRGSAASKSLCANIPEQLKYCNNLVAVPADNKRLLEVLLAHEIGHAFNITDHASKRLILNRVDIMHAPLHVIPGVKEHLKNYALSLRMPNS